MPGTGDSRIVGKIRAAPGGAALDRTHLERQCMGDRALQAELLAQFRTQARALAGELARNGRLSSSDRADLAHRLRGSALAVGAPAVARAAAAVEAKGRAAAQESGRAGNVELSQAVAALVKAVARAAAEIDRLQG